MKTKSFLVLLFVTSILLTSCNCMQDDMNVTPSANITTLHKSTSGFTNLDVSSIFNVYVSFSDTEESVSIEANDNLQSYIYVSVNGETLVVKLDEKLNIKNGEATLNVYVTMPELTKVSGSGMVSYYFENEFNGQSLQVELDGASRLKGTLNLDQLDVSLTGSSNLELSGKSKTFGIESSGASLVKDYSFETDKFNADLDGASELHLTIHESMSIVASGSSMIYYKGNAQINSQNLTGSSKIIKMD